ncbi:MAG TPA: hypothetical protein VEA92_02940 [Candidatus Paceibacterota bacterium]|nr:hypothetical protein [Candidatus Paceibacterota bacterium]
MHTKRRINVVGPFYPMRQFAHAYGYHLTRSFYPLQYLKWKPEAHIMTPEFRRLIFPLLSAIEREGVGHHTVYTVVRKEPFIRFQELLNKPDAQCDPRHIIHMLERQVNERVGYFSDEFVNFARVGPTLWIRIRLVCVRRRRWELHAFDTADFAFQQRSGELKLYPGMRLISRRAAI